MSNNRSVLPYASLDPDAMALEDQITELIAHISAATCRLLELIREFDEKQGWHGAGLKSCAHWLNWKCGIGIVAAREKVRVAHALKGLPRTSAQFREGRLTYSKVRAITRVATADTEDLLLEIARHGTASHLDRVVRGYRFCQRRDAQDDDDARKRARQLNWYVDADGMWVFHGRLSAEQGALVAKALEASREEAFEASEDPPRDDEEEPDNPAAARRADALERMAESFLAGSPKALTGGDRYLIEIHTDLDSLKKDSECGGCDIEDHHHASAEASRRLACDASVVHLLQRNGEPLSVGRKTRTIPPAIRRALRARDGGCRFPGCTQRHFVDAHHIEHWADGGETKMDNLILLCRYHHTLVHEGGYDVKIASQGEICFSDPQCRRIPDCPETRFRGSVSDLTRSNLSAGLAIDFATGLSRWKGEQMDASAVIEAMQYRNRQH